jgi:GrpB-like predicted nucleotidyltransferase (UPF0157 family)
VTSSERDGNLDRVLVGGRERRPIVIVEHDPAWPARFDFERGRIRRALGARARRIEHIGSTAVPGLAAKPIVDVLATVADADQEGDYLPALQAAGYELRVRESGHRMLRTGEHDVHVHVWADSDREVERHLRFRDRLRDSRRDRDAYEGLKRRLAGREWNDMNEYAEAKTELIDEILARAEGRP